MKNIFILLGLVVILIGGAGGYLYYQHAQYLGQIRSGDAAYTAQRYQDALTFYQQASAMKASEETHVRIRQAITALARQQNAVETVEECFAAFQRYARNSNGLMLSAFVSDTTFELYEQGRRIALGTSQTDIETLPQLMVELILELRYALSSKQLEAMTGEDVFIWDAQENLDTPTIQEFQVKSVQYNDNGIALAELTMEGVPRSKKGLTFTFYQQDGLWKLDFAELLEFLDFVFIPYRLLNKKTKAETAMHFLTNKYKQELPSEILKKPLS